MANYNGKSHYTHEIDEKYLEGWDRIFGKPSKILVRYDVIENDEITDWYYEIEENGESIPVTAMVAIDFACANGQESVLHDEDK